VKPRQPVGFLEMSVARSVLEGEVVTQCDFKNVILKFVARYVTSNDDLAAKLEKTKCFGQVAVS
jgi:hypothetical protein